MIPRGRLYLYCPKQHRRPLSTTTDNANNWTADPVSGLVYRKSDPPRQGQARKSKYFQTIIGLEIHAQLQIPTKLFSPTTLTTGTASQLPPNTQLSLLDVAVPGSLPVLSAAAVHAAVLAAAALQCQICETSRFERKHYTYADLPAGYQITQQRWPLAVDGSVTWNNNTTTSTPTTTSAASSGTKTKQKKHNMQADTNITCRIERLQLEQDTAKTTTRRRSTKDEHEQSLTEALVDFNRAGVALIEIVTMPDLRSSQQAVRFTEIVRQLLLHVGVCDGQLQSGSLRVDLNVNIEEVEHDDEHTNTHADGNEDVSSSSASATTITQPQQQQQQQQQRRRSPRVEVKNLNSLRQVHEAALYEARRQAALWTNEREDAVLSEETRTWNVLANKTDLIRKKDQEQDYRFLPEPDLPPLVLNAATLDGCASVHEFVNQHLPELPAQALERLMQVYGLSAYQATVVAADPPAIHLLDTAISMALQQLDSDDKNKRVKEIAQSAANLLSNELFALVKEDTPDDSDHSSTVQTSIVTGEQLGEIVVLLTQEAISSTMAKKLLAVLYHEEETGTSPSKVAAARGFELVTDPVELRDLCRDVLTSHPDEVLVYQRGGKFVGKMIKLFTGKAMAASRGNAHPERLREALLEVLEEVAPSVKDE
jgi:aspartyl-tRNA(Asn)/glutamyl-tRNA(Gln) amidotransferase subunit B